jgi:enamine deaminase RidA (YjgF/YER057c/UK114 family)
MSSSPEVAVCVREAQGVKELYITARPGAHADPAGGAAVLLGAVAAVLREQRAAIVQERVFADASAMPAVAAARAKAFAGLTDAVEPTWLVVPPNALGPISGVQVHALAGAEPATILSLDGRPHGRLIKFGAMSYLAGCNLQADAPLEAPEQARAMLAQAEALVAQAGGTFADIARTWMWLGGILDWYGDFNRVRNEFFAARNLFAAGGRLPASTGIGIGPYGGRRCAMDFCAVLGREKPTLLQAGGNQGSANRYGSAFSRAAVAATPGGKTVYVSGTAAIDAAGVTTHLDDARGQIEDTVVNVTAILRAAGCRSEDVVTALVYCKTPQVEQAFRAGWGDFPMPHIIAVADVCRDNLLFEIEATAMPET